MKNQFLLCGGIGWCLEILWTGLHSLQKGESTLCGTSSIWMFPIYGLAFVIGPISQHLTRLPFFLRGTLYTAGIYLLSTPVVLSFGIFMPVLGITAIPVVITKDLFG